MIGKKCICPRCGLKTLDPVECRNSLSRVDNQTYICPACGTAEAFESILSAPKPKSRWIHPKGVK